MGGWIQECSKCHSKNIINGRLKAYDDKADKNLTISFHGHYKENKKYADKSISQILACFCHDCKQVSLTMD